MIHSGLRSPLSMFALGKTFLAAALVLLALNGHASAGKPSPGALGINLANAAYWGGERSLMNLMSGGDWQSSRADRSGWTPFDQARLDEYGNVLFLEPGEAANTILVPPEGAYGSKPVRVRCKWEGSGKVQPGGSISGLKLGRNSFEFDWLPAAEAQPKTVLISVTETAKADPVRRIDCRETDADEKAIFSSEFVKFLAGFKVLRYLDWQNVNANSKVSWASRTRLESQFQASNQGMSVEHLVALANEVGADPWFTMPWNADEDYIRRFAEYVRDTLKPDRKVYVELSNEVWNYVFPVTTQAEKEGLEANLSQHRFQAMLFRYAEKSVWMLKIWTEVFAAQPDRLVRVVATQHVLAWAVEQILGFRDTAKHIDAFATAPYFGHGTFDEARANVKEPGPLFAFIDADVDQAIQKAAENKKIIERYGKRYIAYEAGQHIVSPANISMVAALNRDERMHAAYKKYLEAWERQIGDLMVIYNTTSSISQHGAWGIREYGGQPLEQTPKRRAILEYLKR
jgi:hypothetical protein